MVGLVGVAGGALRATETLDQLRTIGRSLHAWVVPNQASIGSSDEAFSAIGEPLEMEAGDRLKSVGKQVAHFARLHKCEAHLQFIKEWEGAPVQEDVTQTSTVVSGPRKFLPPSLPPSLDFFSIPLMI
jgi:NAD(P)H-dependent FMN reductase